MLKTLYRLDFEGVLNGNDFIIAVSGAPASAGFVSEYPEVIDGTRIRQRGNYLIKRKDGVESVKEEKAVFVDPNFFNFFSFNLERGDKDGVLAAPNTVALSVSAAVKYFGDENPIGKILTVDNKDDYEVTGVFEDMPNNSHFSFDVLLAMEGLEESKNPIWMNFNFNTYLKLQSGASAKALEAKFPALIEKYIGPEVQKFMGASLEEFAQAGNKMALFLYPMKEIHLHSDKLGELGVNSDIKYIYIFSAVAFFILLIACINFMNLSTARSANRAKEVGIRKVMGAYRPQLIRQFLAEALILSLISFLLAFGFTGALMSGFNDLTGKHLELLSLIDPGFLMVTMGIMIAVGFLAGSYPAFYLSGFRPVEVLKGKLNLGMKSGGLRSALVVFQFWLSIVMIVGTAVVFDQLSYIQNKKLGFEKDHVIMLHDAWVMDDKVNAFKNEVLRNPKVPKWYSV